MIFGINTFLFASPFVNRDTRLFPQFKKWGYASVEIAIEKASDIDPEFVKAELTRHGLICDSVSGCFGPDRDLRGSVGQQKATLEYVVALLDQMVALRCPKLIGPFYSATGRAELYGAQERRQHWRMVAKHLRALCREAEDRGLTLCLEPLNRYETDMINTCAQALEMIDDVGSPALKILLDTYHMNIEEKSPGDAIRRAGKRLGHVHACGSDRGTPGKDHTDWGSIAGALREIDYKGGVVVESFTPDVKVIARAASVWRPIERSREAIAAEGLGFLRKALG